ncbi:MAG TPA: glutaredoxin family protein [Gaiellaceae bacterium]|nr:glutaredoxin family protein [Gaiellaceae bacterium]
MAHARAVRDEHAHGLLRARRAAGRGGDDHAGPVPVARVVLYQAPGCALCERALEVVEAARAELGFELQTVDVSGDPALEARYRAHLPVLEIDGERAFVYFVPPDALRERLAGG